MNILLSDFVLRLTGWKDFRKEKPGDKHVGKWLKLVMVNMATGKRFLSGDRWKTPGALCYTDTIDAAEMFSDDDIAAWWKV